MGRGETIVTILKPNPQRKKIHVNTDFIQVHIYSFTDLSIVQKYVDKA